LEPWINADCDGWRKTDFASGIPTGWIFGSVENARTDTALRAVDAGLGFADRRSLRFVGGVRAGAGNSFFDFAPPQLQLRGAADEDTVTCNGIVLAKDSDGSQMYELPSRLPSDSRITIEVQCGGEAVLRRSLYLLSGAPW